MSLYGLDIIETHDKKRTVLEINGIKSGMFGFREIYGDNRVEDRVLQMLQERYDTLTVSDANWLEQQKYPLRRMAERVLIRMANRGPRWNRIVNRLLHPKVYFSPYAVTYWWNERPPEGADHGKPWWSDLPKFNGQDSTVVNVHNFPFPKTVNPFKAEYITERKFLQYLLLKDSPVSSFVPKTTLIGLGATNEADLEAMIAEQEQFVMKPMCGSRGIGVRLLSRGEISTLRGTRGSIWDASFAHAWQVIFGRTSLRYVEDMVDDKDFSFEPVIAVLQPLVNAQRIVFGVRQPVPSLVNGELALKVPTGGQGVPRYTSIRAIVCNGKFLDAYMRASGSPVVNLARQAEAHSFSYDSEFAEFCERFVHEFETRATQVPGPGDLYKSYFDSRGRTTKEQRLIDAFSGTRSLWSPLGLLFSLHNYMNRQL